MSRPNLDQYLIDLAKVTATRATCAKRSVGAVVADAQNRIVGTGYNGPPSGMPHCIEQPCKALEMAAPASHLACRSIHAEVNAILVAGHQCRGGTLAITTSPCGECAKIIVNAGIKRVIFSETNRLFTTGPKDLFDAAGISYKEVV